MSRLEVQLRACVKIAAAFVLVACGDADVQEASDPFATAPALSKAPPPLSPRAPGTIEVFRQPRPIRPKGERLLEKARAGKLAARGLVRPNAEDVSRLQRSRPEQMSSESSALIEEAAGMISSDSRLSQPSYVPRRTTHLLRQDGKIQRVAEYTYKGTLLARIYLGPASTVAQTSSAFTLPSFRPVNPGAFRPVVRTATSTELDVETYAEADTMNIDEVADYIALTYAMESEVDESVVTGEAFYDELENGELVQNFTPQQKRRLNLLAANCKAADSITTSAPALIQVKRRAVTQCLGRISQDLVGAYGLKGLINSARGVATRLLGRYIVGEAVYLAVGAGLVTGGSMVLVGAAVIWGVYETVNYCREHPADYRPGDARAQPSRQLASQALPLTMASRPVT